MNLTEFINTKINRGYSEYEYYELDKSHPSEYEKLSSLELQYLEDGYTIYKEKNMDEDYRIHTYIFSGNSLQQKIINLCDTKEKFSEYYNDGVVIKKISYYFDIKTSMEEFDKYGRMILSISYPHFDSKFSGYVYSHPSKFKIINKLENIPNEVIKTSLTLNELEKYL